MLNLENRHQPGPMKPDEPHQNLRLVIAPKSNSSPDSSVNHTLIFLYNFSRITYMDLCACVNVYTCIFSIKCLLYYFFMFLQSRQYM